HLQVVEERELHACVGCEAAVAEADSRLEGLAENCSRPRRLVRLEQDTAELDLSAGSLPQVADAELERSGEAGGGFGESGGGDCGLGRPQVVVDRALGTGEGGGEGEVVGELGQDAGRL